MTIDQAAEYLGFSKDGMYVMASEGRVPGFKLGNRWRFKKSVLDRWMEDQSDANVKASRSESIHPGKVEEVFGPHDLG